jgi:hypothetical protein
MLRTLLKGDLEMAFLCANLPRPPRPGEPGPFTALYPYGLNTEFVRAIQAVLA